MTEVPTDLARSLNMNISKICPFKLGKNNSENHCAHYVSHMMGYELKGTTCKNMTWAEKKLSPRGATLRVDDLFHASPYTDLLANRPATLSECLVFVTLDSNVKKSGCSYIMGNNKKKHVGILSQGKVWNYSNTQNKVVSDLLPAFIYKFTNAYNTKGAIVEFYYGKFI